MIRRTALPRFVRLTAAVIALAGAVVPASAQAPERQQVWLRFVDAQKNPVVGVEVKLRVQDRRESLGKSGPNGALVLEIPWTWPDEEHGFEAIAEAPGFQLETLSGKMLRGMELDLGDIVLEPGASASGRVVDRDHKPVAGATVRAIPERAAGRALKKGAIVATSDAQGRYQLFGLAPGKLRVWARHERTRWKSLPELDVKPGDALADLDFMLEALPDDQIVSGTVVDASGKPVAGAELRTLIREPDGATKLPAQAVADDQGRFDLYLPDRPDAAFLIDVEDPAGRFGEVSYADAVPGDRAVQIVLPELKTIALEVKDASGKPIEEFGWALRFQRARGGAQEDVPDARHPGGIAQLRAPSREFTLVLRSRLHASKDFGPYDPKSLPPTISASLDKLPGISGRVTAGGKPVAGAFVQVVRPDSTPLASTSIEGYAKIVTPVIGVHTTADAQGRFELPLARSAGEVRVRAWARGHSETLSNPAWSGSHDVAIELGRGGTIAGRVTLPEGADPTGLLVEAYRDRTSNDYGTNMTQRIRVPVGDDDTYRIDHATPGGWLVRAVFPPSRRAGDIEQLGLPFACTVANEASTSRDLDLRVRKACVVLGAMRVAGKPSQIGAAKLYTTTSPPLVVDACEIDADGQFRFAAGEPGRYRVVWTGGANQLSRKTVTQEIELRAGENRWEPNLEEAQWLTKARVIELPSQ
ncbi:MAG: carboxypeptidase regulatory-like domain-containing protein [Planctomycetota bacterium]